MYQSIFEKPPCTWTARDVIQFLLLDTVNMPYLSTMIEEHGIDGQTLLRLSVDDLTSKYKLRSHDASKLMNELARFSARFPSTTYGNQPSLLPGETLIPAAPTMLPFQQGHVLPPADVAARAAQQQCTQDAAAPQYVPVLLPSDNPDGWYGSVYGVCNEVPRKSGRLWLVLLIAWWSMLPCVCVCVHTQT